MQRSSTAWLSEEPRIRARANGRLHSRLYHGGPGIEEIAAATGAVTDDP